MTLDIWSIIIVVIACQGLFLLFTLLFSKDRRYAQGKSYFMALILILIWFLAEFFAVRNKIDIRLNVFYGTRYGSWFLIGPLTYFYFRAITDANWKFSRKHLWHFMPFVLFVVILPLLAYKALNNRQIDYGMLSVFDHREKVLTTIQWIYSFVFVLQFAHLGGFLFKNLKVIESYAKNLKLEYSTIDTRIKWLRYFNVLLILLLVLSAIFLYILLISDIYRRHLDYIYVLPIGIIFYFVSFKLMRAEWVSVDTRTKYSGSSLDSKEIPDYIGKLDHIMQNEKVYLNNVIRLSDLAEMTSISKHHLSQILNQHYGLSFYDFVNRFRVQEAKNIISEQPKNTLLQVAFDAGFNNKTSFVNAFKKFENLTPSEFRETIKS